MSNSENSTLCLLSVTVEESEIFPIDSLLSFIEFFYVGNILAGVEPLKEVRAALRRE